jgi:hypothetical protein
MSFLWSKAEVHIDTNIPKRKAIDNIGVGRMDIWQAVGREALLDLPENLAINIGKIKYQQAFNPNKLSKEEFDKQYGNSGLEYDPELTADLADYLLARKKQREINEYIIAKGKGGVGQAIGSFGTAVLASFASPTNIALSFVPIGGQLRWAQVASKYGKLAATTMKGAVSGAAFQAGFEPVVAYSRNLEQRDYGFRESLANIGIATTFGATVNVLGYGAAKLKDRLFASPQTLHNELRTTNPVIDQELKSHINTTLQNTYPDAANLPAESLIELQQQKLELFKDAQSKLPELLDQEYKAAKLEESLHDKYVTGGKEENIPDDLLKILKGLEV